MMTIGTTVSANGAEAYFKADFVKQKTLLKKSADENTEAVENTPIGKIAEAEAVSPSVNNLRIEDSDGGNSTALKKNLVTPDDENAVAESEPISKPCGKELPAENLTAADATAEAAFVKAAFVKDSSIESPIAADLGDKNLRIEVSSVKTPIAGNSSIENSNTENSSTANLNIENPVAEQSNSDENKIDFVQTRTRWVGKLSKELGLTGEVSEKDFACLARGIHPQTGEQFIRHVKPRTITDEKGKARQTKSHRAGLDQTLNAPKSVSLVAPYDDRIITAHWRSAIKAVETIEEFTTAKMGNVKLPERTGKAAYAAFLHFEARPDFKSNYAAPDLHTHFFEFNVARTNDGRHRALETREIYRGQKLATAVYRSELLKEMTEIGYEMRIDKKTGAPEIASISRSYIEASSPRQTEIKRTAEELGIKSTKIVASNYRRDKDFDPVEMRDRWREMDEKFGGQAANAAERARQQTKIINSEKQTLAPQKQIPDPLNTAERAAAKVTAAAAVDLAIAQAKEQKDIEVSKRKWITQQSLLTEALNYSPVELRINEIKAEFSEREKNGELREFELDRRQMKLQSERENPNTESANSAPPISERVINEEVIKPDEPAFFGNFEDRNFEDTEVSDERLTEQRQETFRADTFQANTKAGIEDLSLQPVIQDQVIKIDPATTVRLEVPSLEKETVFSETVVKNSFSEQLSLFDRKDFAGEEKSATEALSSVEPPNLIMPPKKNQPNHQETSEIKLEINQQSEQSFEEIYDETGILQSRTRTSGSRSGENTIIADHTGGGEYRDRMLRNGRLGSGGGDNNYESDAISSDDAATSNNPFIRSTGTGNFKSNLTDFRAEYQQENGNSEYGTQAGEEQDSFVGGRKRKLSDRSGSAGGGKSDDGRIIEGGIEKSESGGESDKLSFKPIESVENENAVQTKPDFQPETVEMEAASRLESGAGVAQIKIIGAKSAALRDYRTDDQTTHGGHKIAGNDRADFGASERDGAENTGVDAESERGTDFSPKRDDALTDTHQEIGSNAGTMRASDNGRGKPLKGSNESIPTFSSQNGEVQSADGRGIENDEPVGTRISTHAQRAAGDRTSNLEKRIGEDGGGDRIDSATRSGSEGSGGFERAESRATSRMDGSHIAVVNRAADFSDDGGGMLPWDEQGFEREFGTGDNEESGIGKAARYSTKRQNGDRTELQQYDNDIAADVPGSRETLQSAAGGTGEDSSINVETNRRTAEKTAQVINVKRFSGGLDSQIVAAWTAIIEKSDAADFLNEIVKPKSCEEEQELFRHLDEQAALIAGRLKLPPPEPEAQPNVLKLAVALTEIEAANYEQASGELQSDKVFEVLVKENMRRAAAPPQSEQSERLREIFGDETVELTLKPSSDLEAETLNALLDSVRYGFDASAVIQARQSVNTNEAAAQATATLVQIAYGGQMNRFTDNFKDDLAERIYHAPTPAMDVYQNFRQFDWRQTIESFAPTVDNLAEQYKIEIKPPDTDLERNKLLADFVARQLVEAYESQNSPMEKYVQNQLTANILRAGSLEVSQPQQNSIAALTDQNLEPPKFSNALEANAHAVSKYDDEQKATQAIRLTDQIREAAQIRAEKHAAMEMETERVQVLTM